MHQFFKCYADPKSRLTRLEERDRLAQEPGKGRLKRLGGGLTVKTSSVVNRYSRVSSFAVLAFFVAFATAIPRYAFAAPPEDPALCPVAVMGIATLDRPSALPKMNTPPQAATVAFALQVLSPSPELVSGTLTVISGNHRYEVPFADVVAAGSNFRALAKMVPIVVKFPAPVILDAAFVSAIDGPTGGACAPFGIWARYADDPYHQDYTPNDVAEYIRRAASSAVSIPAPDPVAIPSATCAKPFEPTVVTSAVAPNPPLVARDLELSGPVTVEVLVEADASIAVAVQYVWGPNGRPLLSTYASLPQQTLHWIAGSMIFTSSGAAVSDVKLSHFADNFLGTLNNPFVIDRDPIGMSAGARQPGVLGSGGWWVADPYANCQDAARNVGVLSTPVPGYTTPPSTTCDAQGLFFQSRPDGYWDGVSDLHGVRAYEAGIVNGTNGWMTPDVIEGDPRSPLSQLLYAYAGNNPAVYQDTTGFDYHCPFPATLYRDQDGVPHCTDGSIPQPDVYGRFSNWNVFYGIALLGASGYGRLGAFGFWSGCGGAGFWNTCLHITRDQCNRYYVSFPATNITYGVSTPLSLAWGSGEILTGNEVDTLSGDSFSLYGGVVRGGGVQMNFGGVAGFGGWTTPQVGATLSHSFGPWGGTNGC